VYSVEDELSGKQKQRLQTIEKIVGAFYDENFEKRALTRKQLVELTGLSRVTLWKYMKELIRQGVIRGEVKVIDDSMEIIYEYTEKGYEIKGRTPKIVDAARIKDEVVSVDEETRERTIKRTITPGILKVGKGGVRYFVERKKVGD